MEIGKIDEVKIYVPSTYKESTNLMDAKLSDIIHTLIDSDIKFSISSIRPNSDLHITFDHQIIVRLNHGITLEYPIALQVLSEYKKNYLAR